MNKVEGKIALYKQELKTHGITLKNEKLLDKVTKGLGPSIHKTDASKVSSTDAEEVARVKKNFLIGKLGLKDSPALDETILEVSNMFGSSNKNKHGAIYYTLLVEKFKKESMYN